MKISSKDRYAVSAMIDLAMHDKTGPLTISDIAEKQHISLSYLEQIFAELRKAGLVLGARGPGGGYRLASPPSAVTIAQIMEALGERKPNLNTAGDHNVSNEIWNGLSSRMYEFLCAISLSECIDQLTARPAAAIDAAQSGQTQKVA